MFCLKRKGEGGGKSDDQSESEDDFGWWLNDRPWTVQNSPSPRKSPSSGSSVSMQSCIDSDDTENYSFAQDSIERETNSEREEIEPRCSTPDKMLDVNLIETDDRDTNAKQRGTFTLTIMRTDWNGCSTNEMKSDGPRRRSKSVSYNPEGLVKSQEYRILTPETRYLCVSIKRTPCMENSQDQETERCNERLDQSNNSSDSTAVSSEISKLCLRQEDLTDKEEKIESGAARQKNKDCHDRIREDQKDQLPTIVESNYTWPNIHQIDFTDNTKDPERMIAHGLTFEDTYGPRPKDWSPIALRDVPMDSNHLSLSDELAIAIKNDETHRPISPNNLSDSILNNEIKSIDLTTEEDRFCQLSSAHDPLTRLALAIETDGNVTDFTSNPDYVLHKLRSRVDELRINSKDIYKDLISLRMEFQGDEEKMEDLGSEVMSLRQDIHEVRYLDDLLKLLEGEVDKISQRNWPFLIGRNETQSEELNLII